MQSTDINRESLVKCLQRIGVTMSMRVAFDLIEAQAETLWNWMEEYPEDTNLTDQWRARLPAFMIWLIGPSIALRNVEIKRNGFHITELSNYRMFEIIGETAFANASEANEPIGMTPTQIVMLQSAGIIWVNDLERKLSECHATWNTDFRYGPEAADRLVRTLATFRKYYPAVAA